jgi:hypothetical protein
VILLAALTDNRCSTKKETGPESDLTAPARESSLKVDVERVTAQHQHEFTNYKLNKR